MALSKGASKLKSALGEYDSEDEEAPESMPAPDAEGLLDELWEALQSKDKEGFGKALHEYVLECTEAMGGSGGGAGVTVVKV